MTLRYKICLFAVKCFEDHGIKVKVDRAELLTLSIFINDMSTIITEDHMLGWHSYQICYPL